MSDYSPYNVTLKVITDSNCTDQTGVTTITVLPTPIPDFVTKGRVHNMSEFNDPDTWGKSAKNY